MNINDMFNAVFKNDKLLLKKKAANLEKWRKIDKKKQ